MSQTPSEPAVELDRLRAEIERIDYALVELLAERVRVAARTLALKEEAGLPAVDPAREAEVVRRASALARDAGLDPERVRDVFWAVVRLSRHAQLDRGSAPA